MKILVVEDDPIAIKIAEMIIRRSYPNIELFLSSSGEETLMICQKMHFDLILLDIGLPDCNGYDIAANIKSLELQENTQIYMLSAHIKATSELNPKVLASINGFISKPLSFEKFNHITAKLSLEVS